ncbi:MAG: hypothetical protein LBB19_03630, partial [Puniceicoccales bacterium]|nr:hypothetical protein [Puniceicoccales bacterium]
MLYVCIPNTADNPRVQNQALNVAMLDQSGQFTIQRIKLLELLGNSHEKADCIGHELSHANAHADWHANHLGVPIGTIDSINHFPNAMIRQIQLCLPNADISEITSINYTLLTTVIENRSEAMNLLKLGQDWNFNGSIIGEFDFLREAKGTFCIRMPYWSGRVDSNNQVAVNKLCILIFKLKAQSINPSLQLQNDEIQALALALQDYNMAGQNMPNIQLQLTRAHYAVHPIRGDGNCGFYAILQALHPDQDYARVQQNDQQWQAAAGLRHAIAGADPSLGHLREMVTTPLGTEDQQMGFNALPAVARHLNRPLVVINTTATDPNNVFAYYDQNGNQHGT